MRNFVLIVSLVLFPTLSFAGGWSNWATPTQVDIERGNGVMVYGSFANAGGCTLGDRIFIKSDHPEFDKVYSQVLTAFTAGYQIRAYSHQCGPVGWYAGSSTTFNIITQDGAVNIRK